MSYNLFLDDVRNPPNRHYVVARSTADAMSIIKANGLPQSMSLDHDLGGDDTGMVFIKALQNLYPHGPVPSTVVHSANPVGRDNIIGFCESWRRFCAMPLRRYELPFGVLAEIHHELCACSYCQEKLPQGICISLPLDKSANSWRRIILNIKGKPRFYLRWTFFRFRWINKLFNPRYQK